MAYQRTLGADETAAMTVKSALTSDAVKTVSGIAMVYHGYKRTGSIAWALFWGLMGRTIPLVAVPVAAAQGFATRKSCP